MTVPLTSLLSWRAPVGESRILVFPPGEPHPDYAGRWIYRIMILAVPPDLPHGAEILGDTYRWSATSRMQAIIETIISGGPDRPYLDLRVRKAGTGVDLRVTITAWEEKIPAPVLSPPVKRRIRVDFSDVPVPKPPPPVTLPIPWEAPPKVPKPRPPRRSARRRRR